MGDLASFDIQSNFTWVDWAIVVVYLLAIVCVGVAIRRYIKGVTDFMVAGRSLKTCLAIATMIGTEMGLITVMYSAQKGFTGGFAAFHIALAALVVTLVVGLTGFIVVPLRRMGVMTIPEFYERRFGRRVRILGGLILAFSGILNMGMFLKAGSLFVMGVTHMTSDLELKIIMTILLSMVLLYTTLGGMVSVVVLDYIQFVVLSFSLLAVTFISIQNLGWNTIIETVRQVHGEAGFNPLNEQGFGLSYMVWMVILGLVSCAVWQSAVIRACSAESVTVVKQLYIFSSLGFLIRFLLPYFFGICALVFIWQHPALRDVFMPNGKPASPEITLMAMPVYFSQILPAGLIGIVTAGMLAAFMSTHDSYLLCWSAVLTQDVVAPCCKRGLSSRARLILTRVFIVVIGLYILVWGLWYPLGQDLWDYLAISGAIYFTGAMPLLILGLYWSRASKAGAYGSLCAGFFALLGLKPVQGWLGFDAPSEVIGLAVVAAATLLMISGSLLFPNRPRMDDAKEE